MLNLPFSSSNLLSTFPWSQDSLDLMPPWSPVSLKHWPQVAPQPPSFFCYHCFPTKRTGCNPGLLCCGRGRKAADGSEIRSEVWNKSVYLGLNTTLCKGRCLGIDGKWLPLFIKWRSQPMNQLPEPSTHMLLVSKKDNRQAWKHLYIWLMNVVENFLFLREKLMHTLKKINSQLKDCLSSSSSQAFFYIWTGSWLRGWVCTGPEEL